MKHIFQFFFYLISLITFLSPAISNATIFTINSGSYYYSPSTLTINVGDTVMWINDGGFHDVNGNVSSLNGSSFNNPVSFYLSPISGPDTIGSYVFSVAGTYNYDCSIGNHAASGMIGAIIVTSNSGCTDLLANNYDPNATIDDGSCNYQMTYVPDDNFEAYLEANNMGDGIAYNDSVFTHKIDTITILNVSFLSIADLTGIEGFNSLNELLVEDNDLSVLDLSHNTALKHLNCQDNDIGDLDLINNTSLISLNCDNNFLANINIANSANLSILTCYNNNLTNLNLGANTNLEYLACSDNQLSSLDVTTNILLAYLDCGENQLTILDLSLNTTLTDVLCYNNNLTSLDLSNNNLLIQLACYNNQLSSLDLRNGNNINMGFFLTTSNANLNCISVDDPTYSTVNWTNIDAWTSFSINCNAIYGCTDPNAVNYDASADTDDGSCIDLCNADPQYNSEGIYPNNLNDGYVGQIYDETLTIVVPLTVVVNGITGNVDNIDLTAITGLPNNFTYACNPPNCSFAGATSGCINIYSTSQIDNSDIGNYPLEFYTTSYGNAFGVPVTQNDIVDSYSIEILGNAVLGCTDLTACNFDPNATIDDGSCILPDGCTDPTACNFDPTANCDDGSCLIVYGCTNPSACNYDVAATCDDGSCLLVYGCTNATANNYDPTASCDDGTCTYNTGCTDPTAINYDPTSVIDDGSCIVCDLSFTTTVGDNYCPTDIAGYIELIVNGGSGPYTVTYEHMLEFNGQMYPGYNNYNYTFGGSVTPDTLFMGNFASHNEGYPWIPTPTPIGNQLLTVSDTNGCTVSDSVSIGFNSAYLVDSVVMLSNSSCCGACNASATVSVTGSPSSYSYIWDNGDTSVIATNLCSEFCANTTNTVTIIDSLGCLYGLNFIVPIDSCITGCTNATAINYDPNATYDDGSCVACTKTVSQNLMGFDPNPLYGLWTWAFDTLTVTNTGNCDVRVRPEFNISHSSLPIDSADFDITWYNSLFGFWASIPYDIDANSNAVGFVSLSPNDSTGQIISQGTTQQVIIRVRFRTGANYGNYCAIWDAIEVDTIGNAIQNLSPGSQTCLSLVNCANFGVDSSYTTNISCNSLSDGEAGIISIENGSGNYTYNWSNGSTSSSINNLSAGDYYCIVTDLNWQQCTDSVVFSITEPAPFSITTSSTPEGCSPNGNGTASAIISGGTTPYSYMWSNGQNTATATGLSAGTYNITANDINSCSTLTSSVIVSTAPNLNLVYNSNNPTCGGSNDGFITSTLIEGTLPVSYDWQDVNTSITINTDSAISGLAQGNYILTATDFYGCTFITPVFSLVEPDLITTGLAITNPTCYGGNNGYSEVFPTGVTFPDYNIYYNGSLSASNIFTPASPGSYTVEIVNNITGCSSGIENFTITAPIELTSSYTQTNVTCNGANDGSAIVTFFGGTIGSVPGDTNYILGWAGTPLPIYLPYPQNVFNTTLLPPPYNQIPPGIYPYTVTDQNGCTIYDTITITEPDSISIVLSSSPVCCSGGNDGIATALVNGGTGPYSYSWSNGATTQVVVGLSAGTYYCTVTDNNGCIIQDSIILTENAPITASFTTNNPLCYGDNSGCIYTTASGGDGNYTYIWTVAGDTTADICNLTAGNYSLIITDGCGCSETFAISISQPNPITLNIDSLDNITAYGWNDGSISISTSGGIGIINTSWTNDNGFTSNDEDITNLFAGIYHLELSDSNGCTYLDTFELTQPSSLWMSLDLAVNTSCFDSCDGSLNITANGGDSTYTYSWIGPNNFTSNNDDITNLCDGEYIITVFDGITSITDTFNIYQPQPLSYILTVDSILCHNGSAQAQINVWGGTQPLLYNWSNGSTTYINTINEGFNQISVSDQNNCSISESFFITSPDSIISSTTTTSVRCFGGNDGTANISVISGGTYPYSFLWSNGQTGDSIINLSAGTYLCTITDANGCITSTYSNIIEADEIISTTYTTNATCYGYCDGSIIVNALGGTPPYTYIWNNGQSTQNAIDLCAGFYNVTIYDAYNCMVNDSGIINEPNPLFINISVIGNSLLASSGFASYQWYNGNGTIIIGETSEVFYPSSVGEYYVVVTQGNCEETSYTIDYNINSINDYEKDIRIYPNPANGSITIEGINANAKISIINSLGNKLLNIPNGYNQEKTKKLDLSNLANGIYFIQIQDNNQIFNYRMVLQ